jgi:hypothetical protein
MAGFEKRSFHVNGSRVRRISADNCEPPLARGLKPELRDHPRQWGGSDCAD